MPAPIAPARPRITGGPDGKPQAKQTAAFSRGKQPGGQVAVEYYNAALKHYFMTAFPEEAAMLDQGNLVQGWKRTGGEFSVYTDPAPDRRPVCRFYGAIGLGPKSHFYTADPAECEWVKTLPAWKYEAIAFHIPIPVNGSCGPGSTPVYRSFFSDQIAEAEARLAAAGDRTASPAS